MANFQLPDPRDAFDTALPNFHADDPRLEKPIEIKEQFRYSHRGRYVCNRPDGVLELGISRHQQSHNSPTATVP